MPRIENEPETQKMFTLALLVVSVAALYLAAEVIMPLAMAVLITFVLAPLVNVLERWRLGRVPAVLAAVGLACALVLCIGWIVGNQMVILASGSAQYRDNVIARIQSIKRTDTGPLSKLENMIHEFSGEITEPSGPQVDDAVEHLAKESERVADAATADDSMARGPDSASPTPAPDNSSAAPTNGLQPIPVRVVEPTFSPYSLITGVLPGAFGWLATVGIVFVFVIFMLLERDDLRNRLIRLIGPDQINVTTQALDDAAGRVSRYLRAQLLINACYGVLMAVALYFVGLPSAILLGLVGGLLRYVPYVGPWLGAMLGILLAIAVSPPNDWTVPIIVVALYVAAELFVNNVMEPVMYHSSTGISTVGILVAALFWTWLWGAVGLVLSTPLTVCITVIGRYVPNFNFLSILLSDDQILPPGAQLYQRLLVSDEEESRILVEEYLKEHSLDKLLDQVLIPTLTLTEQDSHRGSLDSERRQYILENVQDLLDELPDLMPTRKKDQPEEPVEARRPVSRSIVIVPARDHADEIAGQMLALRLEEQGIDSTVLSHKLLFGETLETISRSSSPLVIVSAVPPFAVRHARNLTKRLRHRLQGVKIIVGIWSSEEPSKRTDARITSAGSDRLVYRLGQATEFIERYVPGRAPTPEAGDSSPPVEKSPAEMS